MVRLIKFIGWTYIFYIKNTIYNIKSRYAYSVLRGPLLYSLPLGLNFKTVAHKYGNINQCNDYEIRPTGPWAFALEADPKQPDKYLKFH